MNSLRMIKCYRFDMILQYLTRFYFIAKSNRHGIAFFGQTYLKYTLEIWSQTQLRYFELICNSIPNINLYRRQFKNILVKNIKSSGDVFA